MEYWTIEVLDGELSAQRWRDAYGDALIEAAHTNLVMGWRWSVQPWGVALELEFGDESDWLRFRDLPVVRAALDAVPDRISGVLIYPGRGGSQGSMVPAVLDLHPSPASPRCRSRRCGFTCASLRIWSPHRFRLRDQRPH